MKYNTLLVPAIAFATLVVALPSNAPAESDQGKYKAHPKTTKPNTVEGVEGKLPVQPPVQPSSATNKLPVQPPVNGIPPSTNSLPVHPPVTPVEPPVGPNNLPVNGLDGVLDKLPVHPRSHQVREAEAEDERTLACGRLRIESGNSKYSGFISGRRDSEGRHTVVKNAADGTQVDLKGHQLFYRGEDRYRVLGATYGVVHDNNAGQDDMQGNSANFAMLTGTSLTIYGKPATNGQSSFNEATEAHQHIESSIFYFGENREIHANWINKNGQSIPTEFGVNNYGQVIIGANPGQYAAKFGGYAARVFCADR